MLGRRVARDGISVIAVFQEEMMLPWVVRVSPGSMDSGQGEAPLCPVSFTCFPASHQHLPPYNALFSDVELGEYCLYPEPKDRPSVEAPLPGSFGFCPHTTLTCLAFVMSVGGLGASHAAQAAEAYGILRCVLLVTLT